VRQIRLDRGLPVDWCTGQTYPARPAPSQQLAATRPLARRTADLATLARDCEEW